MDKEMVNTRRYSRVRKGGQYSMNDWMWRMKEKKEYRRILKLGSKINGGTIKLGRKFRKANRFGESKENDGFSFRHVEFEVPVSYKHRKREN